LFGKVKEVVDLLHCLFGTRENYIETTCGE